MHKGFGVYLYALLLYYVNSQVQVPSHLPQRIKSTVRVLGWGIENAEYVNANLKDLTLEMILLIVPKSFITLGIVLLRKAKEK